MMSRTDVVAFAIPKASLCSIPHARPQVYRVCRCGAGMNPKDRYGVSR